jgi:hypothetical protein
MKRRVVALAIMTFSSAAVFAQSSPRPQDPVTAALIAKSKSVIQAMKSKNAAALNAVVADDFRIVSSDGKVHGKGELLGAAQEGELQDFMFYGAQVIEVDSQSAIVTYNLILTMPEGDDGMAPRYQKVSDLWVRQGEDWRLKFEQATPLRPID